MTMDELPKTLDDCIKILDENMEMLTNLEMDLEDEKENELVPGMSLHNLYDMTEDVSEASKIKRAEINLLRRKSEDSV